MRYVAYTVDMERTQSIYKRIKVDVLPTQSIYIVRRSIWSSHKSVCSRWKQSVAQFLLHPGCCISSKCGSVPFCTQGVMLVPSVASSFCTQGVILVPSVAQCLLHPGCYVSCKLYQNKVTSWIGPALVSLVESRQGHWTRSVFINCSASLTMHENEGC